MFRGILNTNPNYQEVCMETQLTARDIMTRDVKTITENAPLKEAVEILTANKISGMPVLDEKGTLVGIISEADLMNKEKRRAVLPHMALFGLFVVPERLLKEAYEEGFALKVRDVMTTNVVTAEEDTPVEELADIMVRKRINRIPIMKDGQLVGIVTRNDVLRGLRYQSDR